MIPLAMILLGLALVAAFAPVRPVRSVLRDDQASPGEALGHRWIATWRGPIRLTLPEFCDARDRGSRNRPPLIVAAQPALAAVGVLLVVIGALAK